MKHFSHREWERRQIPREVYLAARERARSRLRGRPRTGPLWLLIPAPAVLMLVIWLLLPGPAVFPPFPEIPVAQLPPEPTFPAVPWPPPGIEAPVPGSDRGRAAFSRTDRSGAVSRRRVAPDRLVMNFVLPRSRVRMIWIKQNAVDSAGGK